MVWNEHQNRQECCFLLFVLRWLTIHLKMHVLPSLGLECETNSGGSSTVSGLVNASCHISVMKEKCIARQHVWMIGETLGCWRDNWYSVCRFWAGLKVSKVIFKPIVCLLWSDSVNELLLYVFTFGFVWFHNFESNQKYIKSHVWTLVLLNGLGAESGQSKQEEVCYGWLAM